MSKKHINVVFDSVVISVLLVLVAGLLAASVYGCHASGNTGGLITSICLYGSAFLGLVAVLLVCCYEYWYVDENVVTSRKLVGKLKTIPREDIRLVGQEKLRTLLNLERDAYIVYSTSCVITIFITKKNAELLREYFADYMAMVP